MRTDGWLRTTPLAVFFFLGRTVKGLVKNFANVAASAAGLLILIKQHVLLAAAAVGSVSSRSLPSPCSGTGSSNTGWRKTAC